MYLPSLCSQLEAVHQQLAELSSTSTTVVTKSKKVKKEHKKKKRKDKDKDKDKDKEKLEELEMLREKELKELQLKEQREKELAEKKLKEEQEKAAKPAKKPRTPRVSKAAAGDKATKSKKGAGRWDWNSNGLNLIMFIPSLPAPVVCILPKFLIMAVDIYMLIKGSVKASQCQINMFTHNTVLLIGVI